MSAIRTAFTDLSTVSVDPGYLVLMADLDGYLKIKETSSNVINVSKTLNYFTQSDSGNYLRWVNPALPGFEIVNGTFSVGNTIKNFSGSFYTDDQFVYEVGVSFVDSIGSTRSGITSINLLTLESFGVSSTADPDDGSLNIGYYNFVGEYGNQINIDRDFTQYYGWTSSVGYTHSLYVNGDSSDIMILYSDGQFGQTNYSTGLQLINKTQSLSSVNWSLAGPFYENNNSLYFSGVGYSDAFGATISGSVTSNKNSGDNFMLISDSGGGGATGDIGAITMGRFNFLNGDQTQISISNSINYVGRTSSTGHTHSWFANGDLQNIMVLYNDGDFIQNNLSTGTYLFNGTFSLGGVGSDPVCGAVFAGVNESFITGIESYNGKTASLIAYVNINSLYSTYAKANDINVAVKYVDLTTNFDQGIEVDYNGTKIVGLTANSNTNLVITNSLENKFEFYNDGNLKMKNNVGSVYFNGVDQYVTVANSLVTPNSHILISASYSGPTTPTIGWVEKGNGTFSVNDKNGLTMSYSYLIINSI